MVEKKMTKEELREDKVVTAIADAGNYFKQNGITIAVVVGLVLAGFVVIQIVRQGKARAEEQAAVLLLDGETQYQAGGPAGAIAHFQEAVERYGGTRSGRIALLRTADCHLATGNIEQARDAYERYLETDPKSGLLRASGLRGLAGALDSMEEHERAAGLFLDAAGIEGNPMGADDLLSAGNAWLDAGRPDEAEKALKRLLETYPNHPRQREARQQLATARALTGS